MTCLKFNYCCAVIIYNYLQLQHFNLTLVTESHATCIISSAPISNLILFHILCNSWVLLLFTVLQTRQSPHPQDIHTLSVEPKGLQMVLVCLAVKCVHLLTVMPILLLYMVMYTGSKLIGILTFSVCAQLFTGFASFCTY